MSALCLNVCRLCVPNIVSLGECFKNCISSKLTRLLDTASKFALFSVSGLKDEKLIKQSKPTRKLKHANSMREYFEYFCQMSSKSILIILSYTVTKFARFWDTMYKTIYTAGRAIKNNPLGKIRYLWNCGRFFRQIYSIYRGRLESHILRILLQYLVAFKNYNYSIWT